MNTSDVQNILVKRFDANWSDTKVEYSNIRLNTDSLDEWVRFTVRFYPPSPINFKMDARVFGCVFIQVFTKPGIGAGRGVSLAEKAALLFSKQIIDRIVFRPHDISILDEKATEGLTTTEIAWFHATSAVDFSFFQ